MSYRTITAKFAGHCTRCETELSVGEKIIYNPSDKKVFCRDCGDDLDNGGGDGGTDGGGGESKPKSKLQAVKFDCDKVLQKELCKAVAKNKRGKKFAVVDGCVFVEDGKVFAKLGLNKVEKEEEEEEELVLD